MSLAAGLIQCLMGVAFLAYGASCLSSPRLAAEFERFGLGRFRILTGWLEIAGGAGLLAGLMWPALGAAAAAGLAALMGLGVWARTRVGDSIVAMLPALVFFVINAALGCTLIP